MRTERVLIIWDQPRKEKKLTNIGYISLLLLHRVQLERLQSVFSIQGDQRYEKLAGKSNYSIKSNYILLGSYPVSTELEMLIFWKKCSIYSTFYRCLFYLSTHICISIYLFYFLFFKPDELYFEEGDIIYISDMVSPDTSHTHMSKSFWDAVYPF